MLNSDGQLVMTVLHSVDTDIQILPAVSLLSFLQSRICFWSPRCNGLLKGIRICHPSLCYFSIGIILSWRQLRINKCRKNSLPFLYQPKTRHTFPSVKVSPSPVSVRGERLITREGKSALRWVCINKPFWNHPCLPLVPPYFLGISPQLIVPWSSNPFSFVKIVCNPQSNYFFAFHFFSVKSYAWKILKLYAFSLVHLSFVSLIHRPPRS